MDHLRAPATWVEGALQDLRFAARSLRRSPGWTAVALLTMALGVGASTTVFQVADALLLRPMAYREAARVFRVCHEITIGSERLCMGGLSLGGIRRWRADTAMIESIVQFDGARRSLEAATGALSIDVGLIDTDFLPFTGRQPVIGRNFTAEETAPGGEPVLLLSEGLWRREYGASRDVLGKVVQMDSVRSTIIGVMPASLSLPDFQGVHPDVWMPLAGDPLVRVRGATGVAVRLRPGVARQAAETEGAAIDAQLPDERQSPPKGIPSRWRLTRPQDHLGIRDSLVMIVAAVGLLLLIACTNVAHLLLARGAARERELAVRHALGAGRTRLLRQLVAESILLASVGGVLAILIARGGLWLLGLTHPADMSMLSFVSTRNDVVSIASGLSLVAGLVIGLAAGLRSAHRHLAQSLRAGASSAPLSGRRLRGSLIVGEVALSTILLVAALLLIHAVVDLQRTPLGFDPDRLYAVGFMAKDCLGTALSCIETPETRRALAARLRERGARIPGAIEITIARDAISGTTSPYPFQTPEQSTTGENQIPTALNEIAPDFFAVMGIRLIAGRTFDAGSAARNEVIVTRSLAARLWPRESAIGHQLRRAIPYPDGTIQPWQTVVGEAPDVVRRLVDGAEPGLYLPLDNSRPNPGTALIVRVRGRDPSPALRELATSIAGSEMRVRITNVQQRLDESIADPRFLMLILAIFATLGVVLASVGLFGVISYTVGQRTREIGIRMTLGATRAVIARLVVGDGLRLVVVGIAIGLAGATAATQLIRSMLYGVSRFDAISFTSAAAGVLVTSLIAAGVPMLRATGVDPSITLRAE